MKQRNIPNITLFKSVESIVIFSNTLQMQISVLKRISLFLIFGHSFKNNGLIQSYFESDESIWKSGLQKFFSHI